MRAAVLSKQYCRRFKRSLHDAGQSGYNMAPVREVLLGARNRFHDLLSTNLEQLTAKAVADDDLQHVSSYAAR